MKNPAGAREHPVRAAGWALWVTGGSPHLPNSHRGYRRVGEASPSERPSLPLPGLLLGRLGGVSGAAKAPPPSPCRQRSGEFRRGKRMRPSGELRRHTKCRASRGGARVKPFTRLPALPVTRELYRPRFSGRQALTPGRTIVTWLILPVVICLSQRLSHACLSISNYTAKLRMAH